MEMWQKLDDKKKKILFFATFLVISYVAYIFSFRPTFRAMLTYKQLKREQNLVQTFDESFPQIENKNNFYSQAIKSYSVKQKDRENSLWQAISGIAIAKDVTIGFNPTLSEATDSAMVIKEQFSFKGNYFNCVQLLDSISKTKGIGRIAELKLAASKENENHLILKLTLVALEVK